MIPKQELIILAGLLIAFFLGWCSKGYGTKKNNENKRTTTKGSYC